MALEVLKYIQDHRSTHVELNDVSADVFLAGIAGQFQLGAVSPNDRSVLGQSIQGNGGIFEKVS
jgi:hypothetical protein